MANRFTRLLQSGDLRSIGQSNAVANEVTNQQTFDELFANVFHADRLVAMRSLDAVEKITLKQPQYLAPHKPAVLQLLHESQAKEIKWHVALLTARLHLTPKESTAVWHALTTWASDKNESRIVRVNALQGLYELLRQAPALQTDFFRLVQQLQSETVPSLHARIRKLKL